MVKKYMDITVSMTKRLLARESKIYQKPLAIVWTNVF